MRKTLERTESGQLWKEEPIQRDLKEGSSSRISHLVLALLLHPNSGPPLFSVRQLCNGDFQIVKTGNTKLNLPGVHVQVVISYWLLVNSLDVLLIA